MQKDLAWCADSALYGSIQSHVYIVCGIKRAATSKTQIWEMFLVLTVLECFLCGLSGQWPWTFPLDLPWNCVCSEFALFDQFSLVILNLSQNPYPSTNQPCLQSRASSTFSCQPPQCTFRMESMKWLHLQNGDLCMNPRAYIHVKRAGSKSGLLTWLWQF